MVYTDPGSIPSGGSGGGGGYSGGSGGGSGGGVTPAIFLSTTTSTSGGNPGVSSSRSPVTTRDSNTPSSDLKNLTNTPSRSPSTVTRASETLDSTEGVMRTEEMTETESEKQDTTSFQKRSYVTAHALNVRYTPSAYSRKITILQSGDVVYRTDTMDGNGWVQITLKDGNVGYVSGKYLREANENDLFRDTMNYQKAIELGIYERRKIVHTYSLNVRKSPHAKSRIIESLYEGEDVIVIDTYAGWSEVFTSDSHGFVRTKYLHE